jgi:predicted nucleic acid-binding protein
MILVDTSVWIEVFRKRTGFRIEDHVSLDDVVTCLPVVQEVLQGFQDENAYRRAHEAILSFPMLETPMPQGVFEDAVRLYRSARRAGFTIRSSFDCLIAACALRSNVEILHCDRDFAALARISMLRQRNI